ncbi:MAG: Flp pilus assembly complex ATPase component TadA [Lachnospiraceae bacterium]|nr:Flp pilus assembly complex ATPase component TadA [Lachnospiraceae bacterium]
MEGLTAEVKRQLEQLVYEVGSVENPEEDIALARLYQALYGCGLGNEGDRIYVKEYIKEILAGRLALKESVLDTLLPVRRPELLTDRDRFEILVYLFGKEYGADGLAVLLEEFGTAAPDGRDRAAEMDSEALRSAWQQCGRRLTFFEKLDIVTQRVYEELYGFSVCDLLISAQTAIDSVSAGCGGGQSAGAGPAREGGKRNYEVIYVMLRGKKLRLSFLGFPSENALECVVKKLGRSHPRVQLSRKNCFLVTGLQNNMRVVVTRPPASEGWTFYVRKFSTAPVGSMEELLTDEHSELAVSLLRTLVRGCRNIVITGEQASGKTTLLKRLVGFIDPNCSIRVAEQAFELRLGELYPERNIHAMQEYGDGRLEDVITLFKKTDTDVTICGEINEPAAADALIQISQSGGRFTMCTSHHRTTEKLVDYMRNALLKHSGFRDERVAERQVIDALHFDIHLEADRSGHRCIRRITELTDCKGERFEAKNILELVDGNYRFCGKISKEHAAQIKKNYEEWSGEAAAVVLDAGEGGESHLSLCGGDV